MVTLPPPDQRSFPEPTAQRVSRDVREPNLIHRLSALWCLLLHLGLSAAGPILDARIETEATSRETLTLHVEEAGNPHCAPDHHHQVCLVRALESMSVGLEIAPIRDFGETPSDPPAPAFPVVSASVRYSGLGPRAPPAS
jgi:hypothetical protein